MNKRGNSEGKDGPVSRAGPKTASAWSFRGLPRDFPFEMAPSFIFMKIPRVAITQVLCECDLFSDRNANEQIKFRELTAVKSPRGRRARVQQAYLADPIAEWSCSDVPLLHGPFKNGSSGPRNVLCRILPYSTTTTWGRLQIIDRGPQHSSDGA